MSSPDLAQALVVIPCLNEEAHIGGLLSRLLPEAGRALVVVADGGSGDQTVEIARSFAADWPNLRILDNPGRIQSAAVNLAVERFGRDRLWLVRVDAHCGYPPDFVHRLIRTAREKGAQSVTVPMRTVGSRCFGRAVAAAQNSRLGTGGADHRMGTTGRFVDHGHHALISIDAFIGVGGYCESLSHNEDAELDIRLVQSGALIWIEPALTVIYHPRERPLPLFRQYFNYGVGRARTMARHRRRLRVRQGLPLLVAPSVGIAAAWPLWEPLLAPALCWMLLCILWGSWIGARTGRACEVASGAAAMIMHFGWSLGFWKGRLAALIRPEANGLADRFSHLQQRPAPMDVHQDCRHPG